MHLIITCEHGGNDVPSEFRDLFAGQEDVLATHRGHDIGALSVAERLAEEFAAPLFFSTVTRLLVELNRSLHHRSLFSEFSGVLTADQRVDVLQRYYKPYRDEVENAIETAVRVGSTVLHLSVHSFVSSLNGRIRNADVGLLYDPVRRPEAEWCVSLQREFQARNPARRVRRNYPYRGTADGFTTLLRKRWPASRYLGIELELNQSVLTVPAACERLTAEMTDAIRQLRSRQRRN